MAPHPLEGLDEIDWSALSHAFGPADDVPVLLRRYWEGSDDDRADVLNELHGNIWHQSTVYEATPIATGFLVAMVGHPQCPQPAGLLHLLSVIAEGMNYIDQHSGMARFRTAADDQELEREREKGRRHVAESRAGVAAGLDVYRRHLASEEDENAAAAAHVLACFVGEDPTVVDDLVYRITTASTGLKVELAQICLALATANGAESELPLKAGAALGPARGSDDLDIYRVAFAFLDTGNADEAVAAFIGHASDAAGARSDSVFEIVDSTFAQAPDSRIDFAIGMFERDLQWMALTLIDSAAESDPMAALVCARVVALIEDRPEPMAPEARLAALDVLASAGSAGIEALERVTHTHPGVDADRALARAQARRDQYRDVSLWWKGPDPSWTAADCIELIAERLNVRAQDQDLRMRATMRLIELGPAVASAEIAARIAELRDDRAQIAAANLLWSASGDPGPVLAILERQFGGGDMLRTADLARRMGRAAATLAPRFRKVLEQDRIVDLGLLGELPFADQAVRAAIEAALTAILGSAGAEHT